jgi:hypothetical protein
MSGDTQFWLGLILSVPIGILTGLYTPKIQKWLESRGKEKAEIELRQAKEELEAIEKYVSNPHEFTQYLIKTAIVTTFIGSLPGLLGGVFFLSAQALEAVGFTFLHSIRSVLYLFGQLAATVGSLIIINICRPALSTWTKVKNFDEFKKNAQDKLNGNG